MSENNFSVEDISGTINKLSNLKQQIDEHPLTNLAEYLHGEYCNKGPGYCTRNASCGSGWGKRRKICLWCCLEYFLVPQIANLNSLRRPNVKYS